MTLRTISIQNAEPVSFTVDPTSTFEPGYIGQIHLIGNNLVCGVCDGTGPFGIIDDYKTTALYAPAIDEQKKIPAAGKLVGNKYVSIIDVIGLLENSNIQSNSFVCDVPVYLKEKNGAVIVPAGTELNYDQDGDGIPDSFLLTCNYAYQVPGIPGEDSTKLAGNRVSLWITRGIFETDQFEVGQVYPPNAPLFCNEFGKLTTRQLTPTTPAVAMVLCPPTNGMSFMQFMWF